MRDWRTEPLERIAEIRSSNVDKKTNPGEEPVRLCNYMDVYSREYITEDIEFMNATATPAEIQRFGIERGDVMITKDSETPDDIGIPAVVVDDIPKLVCGYHVALIKPNRSEVDPIYLAKQLGLSDTARYYGRLANGSTRYGLSYQSIARTPIRLAPLPQQQRIAEILSTVDEAIEQTEALIAKTQQIKAGLMHDLFTRGVTVDGQLRPPREEAPQLYKESPLGWIPKEWAAVELGDVVPRAVYGISASLDGGPGIPVLRMNNLRDGEAELSNLKFSASPLARALLLRPGDVLFNRTNSIEHVGRTGIWRGQLSEVSFASYLVRLDPDPARLRAEFLNAWLNWETTQIRIRRFATPGVHQVNINPTNLRRTTIALPTNLAEQELLVGVLDSAAASLREYCTDVEKVRQLKRGLMHDLLSGRVAVNVETTNEREEVAANV